MDLAIIIPLISGAIGGNVADGIMKKANLGTALNSVVGILGGGMGGQVLGMLSLGSAAAGSLDISSIVFQVARGGIGGGILIAIIGLIKNAMAK